MIIPWLAWPTLCPHLLDQDDRVFPQHSGERPRKLCQPGSAFRIYLPKPEIESTKEKQCLFLTDKAPAIIVKQLNADRRWPLKQTPTKRNGLSG